MTGGLFAVYRDTGATQTVQTASRRSGPGSFNPSLPNKRQKDGFAVFRDNGNGVNGVQEKENFDPLSKAGKKAILGGKGKKGVSEARFGDCGRVSAPAKLAMGERTVKKAVKNSVPSVNGICTGTLRTRVLPPLPPLENDFAEAQHAITSASPPLVTTVEMARPETPGLSSTEHRCADSPASNVDSGYGKVSDVDFQSDGGLDFDDESNMSLEVQEVDTREANCRARALTESPLAEITQAFTGLGGFSNTPASPSPSQHILQRPAFPRKRSSPSKSVSALPPRLRPYSTTATTKKIKPGQTAPEAPKPPPSSRSLRF